MTDKKKEKFVFDESQLAKPIVVTAIVGAALEALKAKANEPASRLNPVAENIAKALLVAPTEARTFQLDSPYLINNKENVIKLFSKDITKYVKRNSKNSYRVRGIGTADRISFYLEEKRKKEEKKSAKK